VKLFLGLIKKVIALPLITIGLVGEYFCLFLSFCTGCLLNVIAFVMFLAACLGYFQYFRTGKSLAMANGALIVAFIIWTVPLFVASISAIFCKIKYLGYYFWEGAVSRQKQDELKNANNEMRDDDEAARWRDEYARFVSFQEYYQQRIREEAEQAHKNDQTFFAGCKTEEQIKKRYKDLCKVYHPDMGNGDSETFTAIKEEYESRMASF